MARAWFFNIPHHGHVNPTLPLVQELVKRGDQVSYFAGRAFAERIEAVGAEFRDYTPDGREIAAFDQSRRVGHAIQQGSLVAEATYELLPAVLDAVDSERPDYLLFDMSAPWAGIAGRQFQIPAVVVFPHLPFYWRTAAGDRRVFRKVLNSVRPGKGYWRELQRQTGRMVRDLGLRSPKDINVLSSSADLNIVFTSRYFQPYEDRFGEAYCFIGPAVDLDRPETLIDINRRLDQPLIYIAVGTVYQASPEFFNECLKAFAGDEYAVIMSVGRGTDPADLQPVPPNFTVSHYLPQLQILREADLFISHGGMNSISEAVMLETPMIVTPTTLEQSVNAARVEKLHAGIFIAPEAADADKLEASARQILHDSSFIDGVKRIRQSFVEAGGVKVGADAIDLFKHQNGLP